MNNLRFLTIHFPQQIVTATSTLTFGSVSIAASGNQVFAGTTSVKSGSVSLNAVGSQIFSGASSLRMGSVSAASSASQVFSAISQLTFGSLSLASMGTVIASNLPESTQRGRDADDTPMWVGVPTWQQVKKPRVVLHENAVDSLPAPIGLAKTTVKVHQRLREHTSSRTIFRHTIREATKFSHIGYYGEHHKVHTATKCHTIRPLRFAKFLLDEAIGTGPQPNISPRLLHRAKIELLRESVSRTSGTSREARRLREHQVEHLASRSIGHAEMKVESWGYGKTAHVNSYTATLDSLHTYLRPEMIAEVLSSVLSEEGLLK